MRLPASFALATSVLLSTAGALPAQTPPDLCSPSWLPAFGAPPGVNSPVLAQAVYDDGNGDGPALYVGGEFTVAGGVAANHIAKWDGTRWSTLGSGLEGDVSCMAVFDDGDGPALYAGGTGGLAKWDGASWSAVGSGVFGSLHALTVYDDASGGGPALYAGGHFQNAGGNEFLIARWNGSSWSLLGSGLSGAGVANVHALEVYDDGSGPALYAGGNFFSMDGVTVNNIARWNGTSWLALRTWLSNHVLALTVFDDQSGAGPALYAGGKFSTAGAVAAKRIARWDGTSWSGLGNGIGIGAVQALATFDDESGAGSALYAGGTFTVGSGVPANHVVRWNGTGWSALESGTSAPVSTLAAFDDGNAAGPVLYAGGSFATAGGVEVNYIGQWSGTHWSAFGGGADHVDGDVLALAVFDDGSGGGPALFAGGKFTSAGGVAANRIAKWDGTSWSALGGGLNSDVLGMAVFDDGSGGGPALYASGFFTSAGGVAASRIARWDGTSWSTLGSGANSHVLALAVFDDQSGGGPALYAGGAFTSAGGVAANYIARWNGMSWSALGSGTTCCVVSALTVFDDGGGPALYVGGDFSSAGGVAANNIARWDGATWSPLGRGTGQNDPYPFEGVADLNVFDDGSGSGPALYAGGAFTSAGGIAASRIARWDGVSWSALGSGMNDGVFALAVFDDGSGAGPALYAGGSFTSAGGADADSIARWDGTSWSALDSEMNESISTLTVLDDGSGAGPALFVGGSFTTSAARDSHVARFQAPLDTTPPTIDCPIFILALDAFASPPGETVFYSVVASDDCGPAPALVCVPPSGSFFPRGITLVTCTATDAAGNESTCQFTVTVQPRLRRR